MELPSFQPAKGLAKCQVTNDVRGQVINPSQKVDDTGILVCLLSQAYDEFFCVLPEVLLL